MIQKDVVAQLDHDLGVGTYEIGVEVHHGAVKLCGRVVSEARKQLALQGANKVAGVMTVLSDIDVMASR